MASRISNANLVVTFSEKLILNGRDHGSTQKITIAGVNEVSKRILTCATTPGTQIYRGAAAAAFGTFVTENVKYIRITNLDDTYPVVLYFSNGVDHSMQHVLAAGQIFMITDTSASFDTATTAADFSGEDITRIDAMGVGGDVDIELLVASA